MLIENSTADQRFAADMAMLHSGTKTAVSYTAFQVVSHISVSVDDYRLARVVFLPIKG